MITFVCHACGTSNGASTVGAAQCGTCGNVQYVSSPDASSAPAPSGDAAAEAAPRLARLWVRPGGDGSDAAPAFEPAPVPPRRRRGLRRAGFVAAGLVASAALAVGADLALEARRAATRGAPVGASATPAAPIALEEPPVVSGHVERDSPPAPVPAPLAERAAQATRPSARATRKVAAAARAEAPPAPIAVPAAALADPAPADRRCVPRALRARLGDRLPAEIAVRFPVAASGAVGRIDVLGGVGDRKVTEAIQEAIRGCPFVPGAGADGRPATLPVVMRIRFAPKSPEPSQGY